MDTFKKIVNYAEDVGNKVSSENAIRSITAQASKAIYYFPVLCSKTVKPSTATMISTNLEHAYTSFVKACFALTPAIAVKGDVLNVEDYLKKFHQNVGIQTNDLFLTLKESIEEWKMFPNETLNEATSKTKSADKVSAILKKTQNSLDGDNVELGGPSDLRKTNHKVSFDAKEIEKKNSIKPSAVMIDVTFIFNNKEVPVQIPVGVKTIIHPVDPEDLSGQIMDSVAGRGILHNLIRYSTGEVMSLSDIVFGISKMKKNISRSKKSDVSRWMDSIDHRKRLTKLSKAFLGKKAFLPNLSINISMDDVDMIQRLIGYNLLTDTHRAQKFIKDSFLLALVITDDATDTAYIMYDGHSNYEEYPYSSLKRENEKTSDAINAMIKGIGVGIKM